MKNIIMFSKINFEAIYLLQKANLSKNLLQKADSNGKNQKKKKKKKTIN